MNPNDNNNTDTPTSSFAPPPHLLPSSASSSSSTFHLENRMNNIESMLQQLILNQQSTHTHHQPQPSSIPINENDAKYTPSLHHSNVGIKREHTPHTYLLLLPKPLFIHLIH